MSSSLALRHVRRLSISAAFSAAAESPSLPMTRAQYTSKLRTEYDPNKVLELYQAVSKLDISPLFARHAQDLTVKRLAKAKRFDDIEKLLEAKKSDPKAKEEAFVSTLIRAYGLAGMPDHANRVYEQMGELGTPRSVVSFNALLSACNHCKLFDRVCQLFDEMPERHGFLPDKVSYGLLVKAYCDDGKPELGVEKLKEMEERGVEVTVVTFTTILHALYKKGRVDEAERLWSEMTGKGFVPDTGAYNVRVMNAQDGKVEDLVKMIEEMKEAGVKPDTITYNYLMTCYCKNGMIDEAKKVYEGLDDYGCNPHGATFGTLIHYLAKNEMFEYGYRVFKDSVRGNKMPDFCILKPLVVGLAKRKSKKRAQGIIRAAKKNYPPSFLETLKKVEEELGLVGDGSVDLEEAASASETC
ncbi:hypothetical protein DCAR_0729785 [Daucus carota subsp. sativus]|uniref:Uncharacterized protein n=1 Tax=Daucus carota subsp. sativus TaxID=79200 RepID=A0A161X8H8_DAUCS|nr:PREDICTED: pentatricopeptide repeat-containing protein At4g36680, mitochondrial [Daucus carota subsp. sativus]WOH10318.1 hypothetical protein DCAR_0729785 [Daucus carota subsp. sativus]